MKHINLKSIFATFLLLVGVCQASWGYNWSEGKTLYFDNSETKWTDVYIIIGHDAYNRAYKMAPVENSTLYSYTMEWGGYTYFVVSSSLGTSSLTGVNNVNIDNAIQTCTSRTDKFKESITSDVLIEVTGSSPYTIQKKTEFNLDDYATNLPVTLPTEKKVSNLILFNTENPVLGAWLWNGDNDNDKTYSTTVTGSANGTTLSYRDNSTNSFKSAIGFKCSVTDGGSWPGDSYKETGDITSDGTYTDGNRYYHKDKGNKFLQFTHISSNFSVKVSGSTVTEALSEATLTLEASNTTGTLYIDGGNNAKYAFYVKTADGTITRLQSFSTSASTNYTAPAIPQIVTLYCYVQDVYGLETIQYSKEITITDSVTPTTYTVTISAGEGGSVEPNGEQQIGSTPVTITATPTAGYKFDKWTTTGRATVADATAATTSVTATADGTVTANFVSSSTPSGNVVYFVNKDKKPGTIYAYAYTENNGKIENAGWPGVAMIKEDYQLQGAEVWKYESPTQEYQMVIFTNKNSGDWQTSDLTWTNGKYYYDGKWYTRAELEAEPAQKIYVQGRFRVREGENANTWKYTGGSWGGWNTASESIQFEYDADTKLYKLNTYCSVAELADGNGQPPYFFFTIGNTNYGAQTDGATPTLETAKSTIAAGTAAGTNSFQFTSACPNGENVVLYLDWENKQFWYECEDVVITNPCIALYGNFSGTWEPQPFSASDDNTQATCTLRLTKGTYQFGIRQLKTCDNLNDQAAWWHCAQGTVIDANNCNDIAFRIKGTPGGEADPKIVIEEDENYIFTYTFATNTLSVTYPNSNTINYRLVYAEKNGNTYEKFHPSTPYIRGAEEGSEKQDIVSLHVSLQRIKSYKNDGSGFPYQIDATEANPNTLSVILQKQEGNVWTTIEEVAIADFEGITSNGVYNFTVLQDAEGNAGLSRQTSAYSGKYYIRTDVAPGGWNDYTNSGNVIFYSDYAANNRHFNHYWCKWGENSPSLKFTIANDYSNCVSDTCTTELVKRSFTQDDGRLNNDANVRFMWNSIYNILDRAYIAGAGGNLYLQNRGNINDANSGTYAFTDRQNWTYVIDVTAKPSARFAISKKPHNNASTEYWVVGSQDDSETLIKGEGRDSYTMRIVYDFKSDHLIYAWLPEDGTTIDETIDLEAAIVCMREDHKPARQITITPSATTLKNVHEALGVLSLTNDEFNSNKNGLTDWKRDYYWISFPFDVNVSDIFSTFVWDEDYIIQEYDGASRAQYGCWSDSPSYWRSLTKADTMKKGKGYMLYISHEAVQDKDNPYNKGDGVNALNIYFPSTGRPKITGEQPEIEVPSHPCKITRNNRDIYDSNWNLIGVPTWVNIAGCSGGDLPENPEHTGVSYISGDQKVGFYYRFNTGMEGLEGNTWTAMSVQDGLEGKFQNMYSYLVQWTGIIKWASPTFDTPSTQGLQARRAAEAKDEQYTLRLELSRGEAALDQTFVRLQEDENVTADYDMNYDMTKIVNPGANLYSLIGEKRIQAGANVLPLPAENTTVYVPVGVVADKDGMYRFSMPDGTEGMLVSIADHETGMTYSLATSDYEVPLTAGTYEQRFVLEIQPKKNVTTGCNESTADEDTLRKVLIDGNLYIQRGDTLYDAAGRVL